VTWHRWTALLESLGGGDVAGLGGIVGVVGGNGMASLDGFAGAVGGGDVAPLGGFVGGVEGRWQCRRAGPNLAQIWAIVGALDGGSCSRA
jgi:hypothetical protein